MLSNPMLPQSQKKSTAPSAKKNQPATATAPSKVASLEEKRGAQADKPAQEATLSEAAELFLAQGVRRGKKAAKVIVARERIKYLIPDIKFDVLLGRWTIDSGKTFLSTSKLSFEIASRFRRKPEWDDCTISPETLKTELETMKCDEDFKYDSRQEYFDGLAWDGSIAAAEEFLVKSLGLKALQLQTDFEALLVAKHLVGSVARVEKPGEHVQAMLILQGVRNSGKSTTLEALCPRLATDYVQLSPKEILDPDSKRLVMRMEGRFIAVVDEVDQITTTEDKREQLKAFISAFRDEGVRMFGTEVDTIDRSFTLWGTVNPMGFIPIAADEALQRRFFPVRTLATRDKMIDNPWIEENRSAIWAAAKALYKAGWSWKLNPEEWKQHDRHIRLFLSGGETEEKILNWMLSCDKDFSTFKFNSRYTSGAVAADAIQRNYRRSHSVAAAAWLRSDRAKALGWTETKSGGYSYFQNTCETPTELKRLIYGEEQPVEQPVAEPQPAVQPVAEPQPAVQPVAEPQPAVQPVAEPQPAVQPCPYSEGDLVEVRDSVSGEWMGNRYVSEIKPGQFIDIRRTDTRSKPPETMYYSNPNLRHPEQRGKYSKPIAKPKPIEAPKQGALV